ncbi:MAG: DUF481 domain-containing protein [Vicinamibacterales bacterium]
MRRPSRTWCVPCLAGILACLAVPASAQAQAPANPWTVSASVGLAVTGGNSQTSTFNAGYDVTFDPKTRNVLKSEGLFIRGKTDGELSASRFGFTVRDEYGLTPRVFVFGQNQYLRDRFKEIDYLIAPTGGVGLRVADSDAMKLSVDAGVGGVWEKNTGLDDVKTSGAVTLGEKLTRRLNDAVGVTQTFTGLWKTSDFADALYTFGLGLSARVSTFTQFKVEWLDTYKNRPPAADVKKNDVSLLVSLVFKR